MCYPSCLRMNYFGEISHFGSVKLRTQSHHHPSSAHHSFFFSYFSGHLPCRTGKSHFASPLLQSVPVLPRRSRLRWFQTRFRPHIRSYLLRLSEGLSLWFPRWWPGLFLGPSGWQVDLPGRRSHPDPHQMELCGLGAGYVSSGLVLPGWRWRFPLVSQP